MSINWALRRSGRSAAFLCGFRLPPHPATPTRSSAPSRRSRARPNGGLILTASGASRFSHHAGGPAQTTRGLLGALLRRRRRPGLLWSRSGRSLPTRCWLRRSHPQGREAGRPTGASADQVRTSDQPEDSEGARPRRAADLPRPRRRSDRIVCPTSESGTSATSQHCKSTSVLGGRTVMQRTSPHDWFCPQTRLPPLNFYLSRKSLTNAVRNQQRAGSW
jgi:hypothetical protein